MRPKKFPERVEKFGVVATIYKSKKKAKGFTIAYHVRGELERKTRNSYQDAKQLALSVLEQKGKRRYRRMTRKQVKTFLAKLEKGTVSKRDIQRHDEHLLACEQARKRRLESEGRKQARNFDRGVPAQPAESSSKQSAR